jgi:hypothetical protein
MYSILPGVSTEPAIINDQNAETIPYVNSRPGFGNVRIVKGEDCQIYICNTNMENGHR